jgi:peptidase A4-like protein
MWPTVAEQYTSVTIAPDNVVTMDVTYSAGEYIMTITNNTTGQTFSKPESCASNLQCNRATAEWIFERPGHWSSNPNAPPSYFPLANFGETASLYNDTASVGGALEPISAYTNTPLEMTNGGNDSGQYLSQAYGALAGNNLSTNNFTLLLAPGQKAIYANWTGAQ